MTYSLIIEVIQLVIIAYMLIGTLYAINIYKMITGANKPMK